MEGGATMSGLVVTHNFFQKLPIGTVSGTYSNNLTGDPQITRSGVKPTPFYVPKTGSPLIDKGTNVGLPFQGAAPDIGAHEIGSSTPPANQLPTVSLTSPANNANFAAGSAITVNANASDADGTVSKVEFFNGTTKLGEDLTSPYSFGWSNVAAGNYTISAKATDNAGGTTTSAPINISVTAANTLPLVSLTSPANNSSFAAGSNVTLNANASDANGTVSKVEFFRGNTKLGEDLTSPYSFAWNNAAAGTYALTAKATDNQGGVTTSTAISVTINAPANVPPVVNITSPGNNAAFTPGATITLTASASDANGSVSKVEFYNGNTKIGEDLTSPYTFAWGNVTSGTFTITARATDNQQATTTSQQITILVNAPNTAPTVALTAPANNSTFTAGSSITISATANDSNGSISKVEFYRGTVKLGEDVTAPYSYILGNAAAGSYSVTAKATDNAGAATTSSVVNFTVQPPSTGATVALTNPLNNSTFDVGSSISLAANATVVSGSISKVEFYRGNVKIGEDLTSPYSYIWNNAPAGSYNLTARATDNLAKVVTSSVVRITVVDTQSVVTVAITSPEDNALATPGSSLTIAADASTSNGAITKVEFFNGTTKLGEDLSAPYTYDWTDLPEGTHTVSATATDSQGNTQTAEIQIFVRNSPVANAGEDITLTLPTSSAQLTGDGQSSDGSAVVYTWNQISGPSEATLAGENSSTASLENLVEGSYTFELTVTDNKGLTSADQIVVEVISGEIADAGIPRYFTPNDDGINDVWEWPSLDLYANAFLTIFNRAGQKIYEVDSYQNTWDGTVDGKPLQAGAYYYVIRLSNNSDIKGAVRIVR
jgi:gliding motility-associated-like protein